MKTPWAGLLVALLLVACGEEAAPGKAGAPGAAGQRGAPGAQGAPGKDGAGAATDGSRLIARYDVGVDGSRFYAGITDTMLDEPCAFATASDGKRRCLPGSEAGDVLYLDDQCTHGVLVANVNGCPVPPATVQTRGPMTCGAPPTRVFKTGALIAVPGNAYRLRVTGCDLGPAPFSQGWDLGTVMDPAGFVEVTTPVE